MRTKILGLVCAGTLAIAGCAQTIGDTSGREVGGALAGAAAGLLTAEVFDVDDNWNVVAALGGAAAGALVARNTATRQCAYSYGNGTYYTAPCPT